MLSLSPCDLTRPEPCADLVEFALGRVGRPGEIAQVALFLASGESSYVNGTDIQADGGTLA